MYFCYMTQDYTGIGEQVSLFTTETKDIPKGMTRKSSIILFYNHHIMQVYIITSCAALVFALIFMLATRDQMNKRFNAVSKALRILRDDQERIVKRVTEEFNLV